MPRLHLHPEIHLVARIGWLRAAVLGANDGIVSTASLIVGVAAASAGTSEVLVAGVAGRVAGAMSMAAGEYVSVSSQSDTEQADLARERTELANQPESEREELTRIYVDRGVHVDLASVAACHGHSSARRAAGRRCIASVADFPCLAGSGWRTGGRREYHPGHSSCDILGRACNGLNRWHRLIIRNRGVIAELNVGLSSIKAGQTRSGIGVGC